MRSLGSAVLLLLATVLPARPADPVAELHRFLDEEWERSMREYPEWASGLGDLRTNALWTDMSLEAIERRHAADKDALARLERIDRAGLPPAEQLNYDLFRREARERIEGHRFRSFLMPLHHKDGLHTVPEILQGLLFRSVKDYEDWIARLNGFGKLAEQHLALLELGMKEGRMPPRFVLERVGPQLAEHLVDDPTKSPFYQPLEQFPAEVPEGERSRLRAAAQEAIRTVVVPAMRRYEQFYRERYLPKARATVGVWDLPDGAEYYAYLARHSTTTTLTPDQIHEIGLKEVARIHEEMEAIIRQVGFQGSFGEFLDFLRNDPKFRIADPQELMNAYLVTCKRIDPELTHLFKTLPRTPYGVRPIPDLIAPYTTTAYYDGPSADGLRPGYFYVNLYKPESRPTYEIEVLTVHEAVPGHHLQIALAMEQGELPKFRRYGGHTAYIEGWGLYSESLGDELGLYKDPYSKFGQLTYEMWRAVRLVVDTGMHAKRWERQQAIDYFRENAAKSLLDIENEIDRYIVAPGQALAYKIGELKLKELRERARQRLGDRFDIREFHDVVLLSGSVPLDVLEGRVDAWIEATAK